MKTKIGLSKESIHSIVEMLKEILANHYILYFKTLNCHWNVEDSRFLMLHELFEDQYVALAKQGDGIAERIRILGQKTPGSMKAFLESGSLEEINDHLSANEMLEELAQSHEHVINILRKAINLSEKLGDPGTANFLTDLVEVIEKFSWLLRSHL